MQPAPDERYLIVRHAFDARALVGAHPPRFTHPHKKLVYALGATRVEEIVRALLAMRFTWGVSDGN